MRGCTEVSSYAELYAGKFYVERESQGDSVKGKRRVTEISGFGIGTA